MERRLSAILAVDVVGYSRLMSRTKTARLNGCRRTARSCFKPEIEMHRGSVFKLMGDGLLAEVRQRHGRRGVRWTAMGTWHENVR